MNTFIHIIARADQRMQKIVDSIAFSICRTTGCSIGFLRYTFMTIVILATILSTFFVWKNTRSIMSLFSHGAFVASMLYLQHKIQQRDKTIENGETKIHLTRIQFEAIRILKTVNLMSAAFNCLLALRVSNATGLRLEVASNLLYFLYCYLLLTPPPPPIEEKELIAQHSSVSFLVSSR